MEITVAGTAQVLHLIPFYTTVEHHGITNRVQRYNIFFNHHHIYLFFWLLYTFRPLFDKDLPGSNHILFPKITKLEHKDSETQR